MNGSVPSLVITCTLNRDEDPLLFDHLAAFKKGRHRRAMLGKLISMGFEHEKSELRARDPSRAQRPTREPAGEAPVDLLDDLIGDSTSKHVRS